ncbi:MAG: DUF2634 domain-containing protein [Hydrogenoanaerobacterium sp.]
MADERKVPVFDWDAGEFVTGIGGVVKVVTGIDAAAQVIQKAENTQRGKYTVYGDLEDLTKNHIYGSMVHEIAVRKDLPEAVRLSEMEREAREAIIYDPWVVNVTDIKAYSKKDRDSVVRYYVDLTIETIFGILSSKGVEI